VREEYDPAVADVVVEFDFAFRRVLLEIWRDTTDMKSHVLSPPRERKSMTLESSRAYEQAPSVAAARRVLPGPICCQ
jgi:hypothetical protein